MATINISNSRRRRLGRRLLAWWREHKREFDWRSRPLTSYEVAVLEILLRRTTATAVANVYPSFIERFPGVTSIAGVPHSVLSTFLKGLGLENQRASDLKNMAQHVLSRKSKMFAAQTHELEKTPGLGPYAARAIQVYARGRAYCPIDSNVSRVFGRVFRDAIGSRPRISEFQDFADALVTRTRPRAFNWALMDLGATVCRYDRPRCEVCSLSPICDFFRRNNPKK